MATLAQVIAGDPRFAGDAIAIGAIREYLMNDQLFNTLEFSPQAMKNSLNAFEYAYNVFGTKVSDIKTRKLGENGVTPSNHVPTTKRVKLGILSGDFQVDVQMARGNVSGSITESGFNNYVVEQLALKMDDLVNGFAIKFIKGDSSNDSGDFDGLEKLVPATRVSSTAIDLGDFEYKKAQAARAKVNAVINNVKNPNAIITTYNGMNYLTSIDARNGIVSAPAIINGVQYATYGGLIIIPLTTDCFSASEFTTGEPFYVVRMSENKGLKVVIPNDGKIMIIHDPRTEQSGNRVKTGYVEMNSAVALNDLLAVYKGYITSSTNPLPDSHDNSAWEEEDSPSDSDLGGD